MVAASFPNLSFENPPGTGPTLLSTVAEPYVFVDGDIFSVTFAGARTDVVFLATDFADIAAATAAEVAALIALRVDDLNAEPDGGFVRLTSDLTGEDVSLQVLVSTVNTVLVFSTVAVNGETYAGGPPNGWTVSTDTYLVNEHAEFADENGRPEEIFDGDGWVAVSVTDTYEAAIFDSALIPSPFETFTGWAPGGVILGGPSEQGSFDVGTPENMEDFEEEWGSPTYFAFLPVHLETGIDPETFATGWGDYSAPTYSGPADFDDGTQVYEDFEDVVLHSWVFTVAVAAGGDWVLRINGVVFPITAGGGDNATTIAAAVASQLAGSPHVTATAATGTVFITPNSYDTPLVITYDAPAAGQGQLLPSNLNPSNLDDWTGQDINPDFD